MTPLTDEYRELLIVLLEEVYGDRVTIEVQEPCGALWVAIEGDNGDFSALIESASSPFRQVPHRREDYGMAA